jgi:hypothetical protein
MSAALIDLVSVGAQDVYITGQPEVSFFRQNYKRHTNFSIKPERLDYIGTFASGNEVTIPIKSKGDLLSYVWIEAENIGGVGATNTGFFDKDESTTTEFQLWIGGQKVSQIDALYIQGVHNILYKDTQAKASCAVTLDEVPQNALGSSTAANHYILPFFFSDDWTKALPLVGLQYHDVEIRVKCRGGTFAPSNVKVFGTYVYLDTDEREFFTNTEHEILFTQTQYQPMTPTDTEVDLNYFNHPVKANKWSTNWTFDTSTLYINGTPLFENMSAAFHHNVVPEMHCSILPQDALSTVSTFTWPFCTTMNKSQPTGTLNFSRIDNAKLAFAGNDTRVGNMVRAYAVNYNILRVKNGMAGVAFGN